MSEIIMGIVVLILSLIAFVISILSFMQKGFMFNNAYIYATKEERKKMNKKPYYRQTAITFLLIGIIFLLLGINIFLKISWLSYVSLMLAVVTLIYSIVSTVKIERKK